MSLKKTQNQHDSHKKSEKNKTIENNEYVVKNVKTKNFFKLDK